jgi:ATP-dependent DNA ligase
LRPRAVFFVVFFAVAIVDSFRSELYRSNATRIHRFRNDSIDTSLSRLPYCVEFSVAFQRKKTEATGVKAPFLGFVEPALASSITKVPSGSRWIHEIKFDG